MLEIDLHVFRNNSLPVFSTYSWDSLVVAYETLTTTEQKQTYGSDIAVNYKPTNTSMYSST